MSKICGDNRASHPGLGVPCRISVWRKLSTFFIERFSPSSEIGIWFRAFAAPADRAGGMRHYRKSIDSRAASSGTQRSADAALTARSKALALLYSNSAHLCSPLFRIVPDARNHAPKHPEAIQSAPGFAPY